jgi:DNA repair ATPase RecN
VYLIFISEFDIFKLGRNTYSIKRMIDNSEVEVSNGILELYFNSAVKDDTEISEFLQYLRNSDSGNDKYDSLSDRVKYYKETEEGVKHMCEAVRNYGDEREAKGEALNRVNTIKTIMKNTKCSLEEALSMTGCTMEEYNKSVELVESLQK